MIDEEFKHPPIIEAIVEVRWELKEKTPNGYFDPYYQLLLGAFYEKIKTEYPFHEPLPASVVPDEVTGAVVKHRFRIAKDSWPLVQIGPGVITVNETEKYGTFELFKTKTIRVVQALFDSHPQKEDLNIKSLQLTYIDAKEYDYAENNICDFLTDKMHIETKMPDFLLISNKTEGPPVSYSMGTSLRCKEPPGIASLKISSGHKFNKRAIIWHQILKTSDVDVPDMPSGFGDWIVKAHEVVHAWFSSIIEGELKEEFNSD